MGGCRTLGSCGKIGRLERPHCTSALISCNNRLPDRQTTALCARIQRRVASFAVALSLGKKSFFNFSRRSNFTF